MFHLRTVRGRVCAAEPTPSRPAGPTSPWPMNGPRCPLIGSTRMLRAAAPRDRATLERDQQVAMISVEPAPCFPSPRPRTTVEQSEEGGRLVIVLSHPDLHQQPHGHELQLPYLTDDRAIRALTEGNEAFTEWRIARARLEIVVSDDECLKQAIDRFNAVCAAADGWVSPYLKEGEHFHFGDVAEAEHKIWTEMRAARHDIINRCQIRSRQDARWRERIRLTFSNR